MSVGKEFVAATAKRATTPKATHPIISSTGESARISTTLSGSGSINVCPIVLIMSHHPFRAAGHVCIHLIDISAHLVGFR